MVLAINALAFALGVLSLQFMPSLADSGWLFLLPICLFFIYFRSSYSLCCVLASGFLWALLHAHMHFYYQLPEQMLGKDLLLEGRIVSLVEQAEQRQRFEFEVIKPPQHATASFPKKIRLSWYRTPVVLQAGQIWRLKVRLKPAHGFRNPKGFDYERWLYMRGIQATGYVRSAQVNQLLSQTHSIDYFRQELLTIIQASPRAFNAVLAALVVGDKSQMSESQWQVFRQTGTSHLMAISGLHIGLVAMLIFYLAQKICPQALLRYSSAQQFAAILALLAAYAYALLAGFSIPTQRAVVMLSVVLIAVICKRSLLPMQALSMALIAVLIIDPVSILSAGFYLSFLAVAAIAYSVWGRLGAASWLLQANYIQWRLALFLAPITLIWFQQASIISPLANIVVVPWVSLLVVPLALIASLFSFWMKDVFNGLLDIADYLLGIMWLYLEYLSALPFSYIYLAANDTGVMVLAFFGVILLLAPKAFPLRALGVLWLLPLIFNTSKPIEKGHFQITMLDVGQGLSLFIQTQQHRMIFDSGAAFSKRFNVGDRVIVPYLRQHNIHQLDLLLISHADKDHIGGAQAIIDNIEVWQLMGSGISQLKHPRQQACKQGQQWYWDGVLFEILHPDRDYPNSNNRSCVLKISTAKRSVLITADIEKEIEQHLLNKQAKNLLSDLLIVPHHGSNSSSTMAFIEATSAKMALLSAGFANRFQHPHSAVMARYQRAGIDVYNTANEGAIMLEFNKDDFSLQHRERRTAQHYWQAKNSALQ